MLSTTDFARFLNDKGWQGSDVSFVKGGLEIWRDTSSWVEVYTRERSARRLLDYRVETSTDLHNLITLLEALSV